MIVQYEKLATEGITYRLHGKTITKKHFDFENTIIKELQTQVDLANEPWSYSANFVSRQWIEGVGSAQKLFLMHVVYEYCSNEPFAPVPEFTSQPKSSQQFCNLKSEKDENGFSADSKLSIEFAIEKATKSFLGESLGGCLGALCLWDRRPARFACHDPIAQSKNKRFYRSQMSA